MNILYKSSRFATYSQYIVTPIIVGTFLYQIYLYFTNRFILDKEIIFFFPLWLWVTIIVIVNITKLRYITVTENNILSKTLNSEEVIQYKDIEWVNQNIFGSNWYIICIKYKNNKTNKYNTILVLPEMYTFKENISLFNFTRELNMTKYIREQTTKAKPYYSVTNEPSRWYLIKLIFLSIIPFVIISFILL